MMRLRNAGTDHRKIHANDYRVFGYHRSAVLEERVLTHTRSVRLLTLVQQHKIANKEFDVNDFSHEHIEELDGDEYNMSYDWLLRTVDILNYYRTKYIEINDKIYWWQMIQLLRALTTSDGQSC